MDGLCPVCGQALLQIMDPDDPDRVLGWVCRDVGQHAVDGLVPMQVPSPVRSDAAAQRARSLSHPSTTTEGETAMPQDDQGQYAAPTVAARFWVSEITESGYQRGATKVALTACTRGPENKTWAAATPVGTVAMTIQNPSAAQWFRDRLGKDVTLMFGEVPDDEQPASAASPYAG